MSAIDQVKENLLERFEAAQDWYLEKSEFVELDDGDRKAIDTFELLSDTLDRVPGEFILETAKLFDEVGVVNADDLLDQFIPYVGQQFFPAAALEFIAKLNEFLAMMANGTLQRVPPSVSV